MVVSSSVLVMCVENPLGKVVEHRFAALQSLLCLDRPLGTVEIELLDLGEPALKLLEIDVVLLEFGIGEMRGRDLLGDFTLEVVALVDELLIGVVPLDAPTATGWSGSS
jgi:hypothetical protein